jgi:hypothetical protein
VKGVRYVGGPLDGATEELPEEIPASGSWRTIAVRDRNASEMIAGRLLECDGLQYLYSFISEGSSSGRMVFEDSQDLQLA